MAHYRNEEMDRRYARLKESETPVDWRGRDFEDFDLRPFLEEVLPTLEFPALAPRALEYGTGTGPGACFLAARGFEVDAIDISAEAIGLARKFAADCGLAISFEVSDIRDWPRRGRRYDLVVDSFCLQCLVTDAEREQALTAVRLLLAPGGHFVIGTALYRDDRDYGDDILDENGIVYRRLEGSHEGYEDAVELEGKWYFRGRRHVTADALRRELEAAGLEVVRQDQGRAVCRGTTCSLNGSPAGGTF